MSDTLLIRFRTILLLGMAVLALAISAGPAFAGEDDDGDDDDAPVPTQVAPAPVPVKPAPAPAQPAPAPAQPAPAVQAPSKSKPTTHSTRRVQTQSVSASTNATKSVQSGQVIPRGGIQTGAGGTATTFAESGPSPVLVGLGGLLALLLLGRSVLLARAKR